MQRNVPAGEALAYEVGVKSVDEQLARIEALDSKAGIVIAAAGVLAALLFGRGSIVFVARTPIAVIAVFLVVLSLLLALLAFANRRYRTAPDPAAVVRLMAAREDWLKWRFLGNLQEAILENDQKLVRKARLLTAAIASCLRRSRW